MPETRTFTCRCGKVEVELAGSPIVSPICHCDDCRAGSRRLEALPGAPAVLDGSGGTAYVQYRKDRLKVMRGAEFLERIKLSPQSPTNRVYASCCNTPMFCDFDRGPFWVNVYQGRVGIPPEMRVFTKFRPAGTMLPGDVPSYETFPLGLVGRLVTARVAMLLGR